MVDRFVWLEEEPELRRYPTKAIQEAKEILKMDKAYIERLLEAWLKRKTVEWDNVAFIPYKHGIEVYIDDEYERSWSNRAIELVYCVRELERKDKEDEEEKTSDEDQVDVDVVVNVEKPEQDKEDEED
jgi:hypothetical protein